MPPGFSMVTPSNASSSAISTLRLFSSVARSPSTGDWSPLMAPTAACWSSTDGPEVSWPWMLVIASMSFLLPTAQPIRKPVIAYCLDTPLMRISLEFSLRSLA